MQMQVVVEVPDEMKCFTPVSGIRWQVAVEKRMSNELERLAALKRIADKSKLTQEQADKLADEVNISLAERYDKLSKV